MKKQAVGTPKMEEIADLIHEGAWWRPLRENTKFYQFLLPLSLFC